MTTVKINISKSEALNEYAELLLNNGFTIIAPKERSTYFHFSKDDKIGYVQEDYFGGYHFSTVHKPCRQCGTGFEYLENGWDNLILENAIGCINCIAPSWATQRDVQAVNKYKNLDDFINTTPFSHVNDIILKPNTKESKQDL